MALLRAFVALDTGEDNPPDESSILQFRHLLEAHNLHLHLQILATVNATQAAKGLLSKSGMVVDARSSQRRVRPRAAGKFGHAKVHDSGLAKNTAQLHMLFALSNLWMARRTLLQEMRR